VFGSKKTFRASSRLREPPRLEILQEELEIDDGYICCDGNILDCDSTSVQALLMILLHCYYAWQLMYPTQYQLLPFLQEHILQDKGAGLYKATTYIKFNKRFTQAGEDDGDSVDTVE